MPHNVIGPRGRDFQATGERGNDDLRWQKSLVPGPVGIPGSTRAFIPAPYGGIDVTRTSMVNVGSCPKERDGTLSRHMRRFSFVAHAGSLPMNIMGVFSEC